ncbi:TAXI family TRAP transporter solute-binding subunit [Streptacidiphilus sp. PB12-B1b]|uniref:TAXI family TRAP transporter solute-binding subunit n=1 Tax=Streptacidiphilus sp. PB12-B1b TaxID=2705012 RepID=UPI0015FB6DE5|nr:TAXI family TRAP transporter solute-binding subunit [Streptacidiphilus sp. PB12-B1b]QMU78754.1 TAXI family TRAP transporter solute-binding subunit [Streptacidiphilus sp. PB12-B1b]
MSTASAIVRYALQSRLVRVVTALAVLAAAGLAWWLAAPDGVAYPTGTFGMATGSAGGVYALYGKLLKPVVQREMPGVRLQLDPTAGGPQNLQRILAGQDDFGIATADAVAHFTGPGAGRLRALGRLYDDYVQLVVPSDSPIHSVQDLRGKRVGVGQADSGVMLIAQRVLQVSGLDPSKGDLTPLPLGIDDSATQLREGNIDAFFWSGGLPSSAVALLSKQMHVRLIPLGQLAPAMDALAGAEDPGARDTQIYRSSTMPTSAYPATVPDEAVQTLAVANLMVTRADVPTGLVERMTGVLLDSRDEIGVQVHSAQTVDIRSAIYTDPLPLAEGARRYYVSVKP